MVVQSELCQKMIQNHINSTCPTDDKLIKYDTSNQHISGKFVNKNGIVIRTNAQVTNHYQFYTKETVCVDCTGNLSSPDLFKMIILEPHGFTFIDKYQTVSSNSWNSYTDRSMQGCNTATIAYSDALLNDTITYLESECTKTSFNNNSTHTIQSHPFSLSSPFTSLPLDYYKEQIFHGHKVLTNEVMPTGGGLGPGLCINGKTCDFKDPYKKAGW